jgi:hypothetical protein
MGFPTNLALLATLIACDLALQQALAQVSDQVMAVSGKLLVR